METIRRALHRQQFSSTAPIHHHHIHSESNIYKFYYKHIANMLFRSAILYTLVGFAANQVAAAAVEAPRDVAAPQGITIATDRGVSYPSVYQGVLFLTRWIQSPPATAQTTAGTSKALAANSTLAQATPPRSFLEVSQFFPPI
jgi:hypothetical protein